MIEPGPLTCIRELAPTPPDGCPRWPETLRLLHQETGELVPGRCKCTNKCKYCARLFAVQTSEMLLLDAMEDAPTLYVVLTGREYIDHGDLKRHLTKLRKALRKRWPDIRWAVLREYTRARRLHVNLLVKGVPTGDADALEAAIVKLWCQRIDAEPVGQYVGVVADEVGLTKYVTLHFMKESQAPDATFTGHRFSCTRDYLVRPASVMREEARKSLALKRELWRGTSLEVATHKVNRKEPWVLKAVTPHTQLAKVRRTTSSAPPDPERDSGQSVGAPVERVFAVSALPVHHGEDGGAPCGVSPVDPVKGGDEP